MRDEEIGRGLRAVRHRLGWRQRDLADRSGIARAVVAELEAGRLGGHMLDALRSAVTALGANLQLELSWRGAEMRRLLDADHAALQDRWKGQLERWGWLVEAEVTFNRYGERGSIDLLAFHPGSRLLLVIEIKTAIVDVQQLLSSIDRKVRLAIPVAGERGWRPRGCAPLLVVAEGSTARRRNESHPSLFARFPLRGRAATAWVRSPTLGPAGLLCLSKLPAARPGDRRRAGRQRIRVVRRHSRSA